MADPKPSKRRIYIVGGKGKNVPPWIAAAFDYEQFDQDHARGRTTDPDKRPDAVVVLSSWVGHKHFYNARDLAEKLNIPMLLSPGGWSASLKAAADLGAEWFISDIEAAKSSRTLTETEVTGLDEFIDNAWREAYNREWTAREALERRYGKDRSKFEHAEEELERLKTGEAAAQRVIAEIRAAAAKQREEMERHNQEIRERSARVARALTVHLSSLEELFDVADEAHSSIIGTTTKLSSARKMTKQKIDVLNAALTMAEEGTEVDKSQEDDETSVEPVSASNLKSD
jgi:hypothetical protein